MVYDSGGRTGRVIFCAFRREYAEQESIYTNRATGHKALNRSDGQRERFQEESRSSGVDWTSKYTESLVGKEATNGLECSYEGADGVYADSFNVVEDIRTTLNE